MFITANREDTEFWRIERLQKAARVFCQIFGITDEQSEFMIRSLHDHKGTLEVEWYFTPTERQKQAMQDAWGVCSEYVVEHKVSANKLVASEIN